VQLSSSDDAPMASFIILAARPPVSSGRASLSLARTTGIILKNEVKRGREKSGARSILAVWKKENPRAARAAAAASANPALGVSVISKDITRRSRFALNEKAARPLHSLALLFLYRTRCMPAKFVCETNGKSLQQLRSVNSRSFAWLISIGEK